jgi:hypothetical protein
MPGNMAAAAMNFEHVISFEVSFINHYDIQLAQIEALSKAFLEF